MRVTIATRIFLSLTLLSLVILALSAGATRWTFDRSFLEYIAEQEAAAVANATADLAEIYEADGDWESLRNNPRRWTDLLRANGNGQPRRRPPGRGPEPGGPPPEEPLELRRVSLLDAAGEVVVGPPGAAATERTVAVVINDETVGFVAMAPRRTLTNPVDQNFAKQQKRSITLIAAAALLLAALVSALLARHLTRPVRALAAGARLIAAGELETRIAATQDSELGDLANDFNLLAATLERNRASRQRWVADIAHELRTPLAILRGELDAIEDGVRTLDSSTRASLQSEVERLTKLVGDLHELSVYDDGNFDYQLQPVDVSELLDTILENARLRLHEAGIDLRKDIHANLTVNADAMRLQQLFTNLLENTMRYTDAPGSLQVTCAQADNTIDICFADSAPGVPARALPKLFDRLFRVDASRNRNSGGSGLGLSIGKSIVVAHGGTISAGEASNGGLRIHIRLPVSRAQEGQS